MSTTNQNTLEGQVAIVTGAASGIGAALVEQLCGAGVTVLAVDINAEALAALADQHGCKPHVADVTSEAANQQLAQVARDELGGIDLAFLNAGVLGRPREQLGDEYQTGDLDLAQWHRVSAVNLDSVIYATIAIAAVMGEGGAIITTASTAGLTAWSPTPFYTATKHGVIGWTRAVAESLASQDITINAICPGGVATPLVGLDATVAESVPRILHPAQVADAMISTALSGATGTAVSVVADREPVVQTHEFNDVPGFP